MAKQKQTEKKKEEIEVFTDVGVLKFGNVVYKVIVIPIPMSSFRNKLEINKIFSSEQKLGKFLATGLLEYLKKVDEEKAKSVS